MVFCSIECDGHVRYNFLWQMFLNEVCALNITMLTMGSTGDVRPYVLLGKELKNRGYHITVAAFSSFRGMVTDEGLDFYPLSGNAEELITSVLGPETNGINYLPQIYKRLHSVIPELLRGLEESCRTADAMICNYFGTVYYSVAEKYHLPCIQTHFFPMDPTSSIPMSSFRNQHLGSVFNKFTYKIGYLSVGFLEKILLSEWREDSMISKRKATSHPVYKIGEHDIPVLYAISPSVFPKPREWPDSIHMSGFWFDHSPCKWQPPEDLLEFLHSGEMPVYIGFGSMHSGNMNKMLTMILRALRAAGLRAVICGALNESSRHSGRKVYFADHIPHDWLFPRVSAVIHHGGAGTVSSGLRWGRPTWILPFAGDQPFWGAQIHRIGCGPKPVSRNSVTVRKLTKGLIDLTTKPGYKKNAADIAACLAKEDGTRTAADWIEQFIREW